jgi:hypothetical protein
MTRETASFFVVVNGKARTVARRTLRLEITPQSTIIWVAGEMGM